jgi:hypothetical protein
VVYDAAHAFGVSVRGRPIGCFGDLSVLSFHATKVFHTSEGGAVVGVRRESFGRLAMLRNFGIVSEDEVTGVGVNGKMSEVHAAMGLALLEEAHAEVGRRAAIAARYRERLSELPGVVFQGFAPETLRNHYNFSLEIDEAAFGLSRDAVHEALRAENVHTRKYFHPLCSENPSYRDLPSARPEHLRNAHRVASRILCIPHGESGSRSGSGRRCLFAIQAHAPAIRRCDRRLNRAPVIQERAMGRGTAEELESRGALLPAPDPPSGSAALHTTRGLSTAADAHQYLIVARSLVQGEGYTVPLVPFHAGYFDPVRHVPEMHGILRPLVLAALFAVGGVDASLARVPGMVYMAAAALVAFLFARRLFGPVAGLVACILTLTCLDLFKWAILGTDDVGFAFFFLSSVALLQRALRSGRDGDFLLAGAVAGLGGWRSLSASSRPPSFLAAALDWRRVGVTAVLRRGALLVVPFALCLRSHFLRNAASYGDPMFRLGALN